MQKTNGQWYTDKNGNHYFVENGQSPKEGWEASKRRKMISKGKYNVSEDGENYKEVSKDDYDKYEADETEFDETVDDDFGFDEEEDNSLESYLSNEGISESFANGIREAALNGKESLENYLAEEGISSSYAESLYDIVKNEELTYHFGVYDENGELLNSFESLEKAKKWAEENNGYNISYNPDFDPDDNPDTANQGEYEDFEVIWSKEDGDKQGNNDNLNPNNPKYKGFDRSSITNAKLVDEGYEFTDTDSGEKVKNSIIEYIPYGALQDGDNEKLYAIVKNYDGTDIPKTGAIVAHSLEDAKEQLERQTQLGIQGRDRYLKRGQYDEDYFNLIRDNREPGDDEKYKERYGWDFNKPFGEHDFMKNDPYEKWKAERETAKTSNDEKLSKELMTSLKMPGDEVERFLKDLPEDKKKILTEWLLNTKRM